METQGYDYSDINNVNHQHPIVGYKLFLDVDGKFLSLVADNPMEFKENVEYFEHGDMAVGQNSFCFGTSANLDILAFAGYDAPIAVGVITVFPPYFLYNDDQRDCCKIGYSQHIVINKIMKFDEVCKFLSKSSHNAAHLINMHSISKELLKELIDKYASDSFFVYDIKFSKAIYKNPEMTEYLNKKVEESKNKYRGRS
ncbi:MAG: hypothetical protein J5634_00685 [Bacilli bacterium]|nr:hypothetical protein [Bacilli bacterium]